LVSFLLVFVLLCFLVPFHRAKLRKKGRTKTKRRSETGVEGKGRESFGTKLPCVEKPLPLDPVLC
jgi:hypothetical protein